MNGFDIINPEADLKPVCVQNHKSALASAVKIKMDNIIYEELAAGNYKEVHYKPTIVSALGAVPKGNGEIRHIHDGSLPSDGGLNSYSPICEHYKYESVDDAVRLLDYNYFAAKIDLRHAYRSVPISKQSQRATGLQWTFHCGRTVFMIDRKLPYGSRASPTIFHRLSQAVKRMMSRKGHDNIVAYQDDFLVTGKDYDECFKTWTVLLNLLKNLGFIINENKLIPPSRSLVFLGIQINTVNCELSLPVEKLSLIRTCVKEFMSRKRATKQQLMSLAGRLSFAARVVRGGRIFLRRLFNAIAAIKKRHQKLLLEGDVRGDIEWWHKFLVQFNGTAAFIDDIPISPVLTDACLVAGGAFYNGDFLYTVWKADYPEIADACINYLEAMMAVLSILKWGHLFKNKKVVIYIDNQCACIILNKGSCKCEVLMQCIRQMFWYAVMQNFVVKAVYMPGNLQTIPDAISRIHEKDGFLRVQTIMNNWFTCHCYMLHAFDNFNMLNHMSMWSLCYILQQVMTWRRHGWTRKYVDTGQLCTQTIQKLPTSVN